MNVVEPVQARVQVEDELLRERRDVPEERAPVPRVVDRAEDGRRGDGRGRDVLVQVACFDDGAIAESALRRLDHLRGRVDSAVAKAARDQQRPEASVPAGEVEHLIPRHELGPEADDELGTMREIGCRVSVRALRPVLRLPRVLVVLHRASRRSGCLRTKRAIPRACQRVWREMNPRSITAA